MILSSLMLRITSLQILRYQGKHKASSGEPDLVFNAQMELDGAESKGVGAVGLCPVVGVHMYIYAPRRSAITV